jgi:hypothetical protein
VLKRVFALALCTVLLIPICTNPSTSFAQGVEPGNADPSQFNFYGHEVAGEFLKTYLSVSNPEVIFGYPITPLFFSTSSNRMVQYFENSRFELIEENPAELRVRVSSLGDLMYMPGQAFPLPPNFPSCQYFPETDKKVCYSFLDYFNSHGGLAVFGYPISNFEVHENLIVQYFQKARFEWHPERDPGKRVTLSRLGEKYFYLIGEDSRLIKPPPRDNAPYAILSINSRAFPESAIVPPGGSQIIYIIVQDQNYQPVEGAKASIIVKLPSGRILQQIIPGSTDTNGILKFPFSYLDEIPGKAIIEVNVIYPNLPDNTTYTSFTIWW